MSAWRKNCLHNAKIILKKAPAKGAFFMQKGSIMEEFTKINMMIKEDEKPALEKEKQSSDA